MQACIKMMRHNSTNALKRMKSQVDKTRMGKEFSVDALVFAKPHLYNQTLVAQRNKSRLLNIWDCFTLRGLDRYPTNKECLKC